MQQRETDAVNCSTNDIIAQIWEKLIILKMNESESIQTIMLLSFPYLLYNIVHKIVTGKSKSSTAIMIFFLGKMKLWSD